MSMSCECEVCSLCAHGCAVASSPHVRRTPLVSGWEPSLVASNVSLKLESLQRTGSFKVRGMAHVFACAEENIKRNGECEFFLELND